MDAKSKYHFTDEEQGAAFWGFYNWLEKTDGKEAAETYLAIHESGFFADNFRGFPEEKLTKIQKGALGHARRGLTTATAWLKAQGCCE